MIDLLALFSIFLLCLSFMLYIGGTLARYDEWRHFRNAAIVFACFLVTAPIAVHLVSARNAAAFDRAISTFKPVPSSVLFWANPRATAALMGPVENGTALGCFKRKGSFSHGWIPADFMVHSDLSIAMAPRPRIANGSMSDGAVRYEGDNKAIVDACKAAEVSASQSL